MTDYEFLAAMMSAFEPEAIVHFAEQRSAPYSMIDRKHAVFTQVNNVDGNAEPALRDSRDHSRLPPGEARARWASTARPISTSKKATSTIEHNGRKDVLPFPKQPGSFYHLSKVHDSHNMMFACKIWEHPRHRSEPGRGVWNGDG